MTLKALTGRQHVALEKLDELVTTLRRIPFSDDIADRLDAVVKEVEAAMRGCGVEELK